MTTYAELAVALAEKEAERGVRETGTNTGQRVREYQAADGLRMNPDTGYPWCASFVCWCYEEAGRPLVELQESASVGFLLSFATRHKWRVQRPEVRRGDVVCFYWSGDDWPDHVGMVRSTDGRALNTVEGNTGPEKGSGPDGVYFKVRDTERMAFFRVPGVATATPIEEKLVAREPLSKPDWFEEWAIWRIQKPVPPRQVASYLKKRDEWRKARPKDAPTRIPEKDWDRLVDKINHG